jgi:predicted PurR-regulated permease PerM
VALYLARSIMMPVTAATIIGLTLHPIQKYAESYKIPPFVTAVLLVLLFSAALYGAVSLVLGSFTGWLAQSPDIGGIMKEKFGWLERHISTLRQLMQSVGGGEGAKSTVAVETNLPAMAQAALAFLTPAVSEFLVFLGTLLFFLIGSQKLRRQLITYFGTREARLRAVRIWNDIEHNLITYVGTVSVINLGVGAMTAAMLYVLGFPSPLAFGILAFALNYVPYIGPAIIVATLFGVGLVTTPSLGAAILPPLLFVVMTTIEGHFLTPSVIGRRLTLSPFLVFLALAFWTWLWGPFGAFMATPLLIVGLVVLGHLFPRDEDPALPQ